MIDNLKNEEIFKEEAQLFIFLSSNILAYLLSFYVQMGYFVFSVETALCGLCFVVT